MKFSDLFKNKKNIQFAVMIIFVLLLAGGVWQYRNFVNDKLSQMEMEELLDNYDDSLLMDESDYNVGLQMIDEKASEGIDKDQPIKEVSTTDSSTVKDAEKQKAENNAVSAEENKNSNKAASAIKTDDEKMEAMVLPVFGSMNSDFCDSSLVYSKTLDQWTTHNGIDIKAEEGSQVRAAMDGIITQVKNDQQWGLTIVIDHGSGIVSKYCNLSTLDLVSVGQKIKKGDVISGVGKTALCEIVEEPHLHFEVLKDGKHIDPKNYLPKQSLNR